MCGNHGRHWKPLSDIDKDRESQEAGETDDAIMQTSALISRPEALLRIDWRPPAVRVYVDAVNVRLGVRTTIWPEYETAGAVRPSASRRSRSVSAGLVESR